MLFSLGPHLPDQSSHLPWNPLNAAPPTGHHMKVKISIKPFFWDLIILVKAQLRHGRVAGSHGSDFGATQDGGDINLRFLPCSSHLCGSSWPSLAVSLAFFVFSLLPSSIHYCPHKWLLSEISYYDTLSLHSMSICFWTSVIKSRVLQSETIHHPSINPSIQLATLSFCRRSERSQNNPSKRHVPLAVLYHKSVLGKIIEL